MLGLDKDNKEDPKTISGRSRSSEKRGKNDTKSLKLRYSHFPCFLELNHSTKAWEKNDECAKGCLKHGNSIVKWKGRGQTHFILDGPSFLEKTIEKGEIICYDQLGNLLADSTFLYEGCKRCYYLKIIHRN